MLSEEDRLIRTIAQALALRVGNDADAAQIAEAMVSTWHEIAATLAPILGHRGVAAIYRRARFVTGQAHPWLLGIQEDVHAVINLDLLKASLASQSRVDAAAGGSAFLHSFVDLLASLIGAALTERMLRSVWTRTSSAPPAQDTPP